MCHIRFCVRSFQCGRKRGEGVVIRNFFQKPLSVQFLLKIFVFLDRDFPLGSFIRPFFQFALKENTGQRRIGRTVILRRYGNNDSAVGAVSIPVAVAHAVDSQISLFRRGVHHISAGAHTERIYAPTVFRSGCYFIGGCAQKGDSVFDGGAILIFFIFFPCSVLRFVDKTLRMLYPEADSKWLCFHGQILFIEHGKRVPRTVADGKHKHVSFQPFASVDFDSGYLSAYVLIISTGISDLSGC